MKKRQYPRIPKVLSLRFKEFETPLAGSEECPGFLKDISLGGIYFKCKEVPTFEPGSIIEFNLGTANTTDITKKSTHFIFKGRGRVIRIEPPDSTSYFYGIAVEFLTPLDFSQLLGSSMP